VDAAVVLVYGHMGIEIATAPAAMEEVRV